MQFKKQRGNEDVFGVRRRIKMPHNKPEGFFEGLLHDATLFAAVQASKDDKGKPDPYKAAGMAAGMGYTSLDDLSRLGAMLGAEGAFDDD